MIRFQHYAELHTAPLSLILALINMLIHFPQTRAVTISDFHYKITVAIRIHGLILSPYR